MRSDVACGVLAAVVLAACGARPSAAARHPIAAPLTLPPSETGVVSELAATEKLPKKEPVLRLLDPGAAARATLRYQFRAGECSSTHTTRTSLSMLGEDLLPAMHIEYRMQVTGDADRLVHVSLSRAGANGTPAQSPVVVQAADDSLRSAVGSQLALHVSPRGQVTLDDPSGARSLRSAVEQGLVPLPAEAVGLGASWQVLRRTREKSNDNLVLTTYRLLQRAGDHVRIDSTSQAVRVASDAELDVSWFKQSGRHRLDVDLGQPCPVGGTSDYVSELRGHIHTETVDQPVSNTGSVHIDYR